MGSMGHGLGLASSLLRYHSLYHRFRRFTFVARDAYITNLYLVRRVLAQPALAAGCIVECGTWRGGMAAGLVTIGGAHREYHFFDSFGGLPPASEADGAVARAWQAEELAKGAGGNCTASRAEFDSLMARIGAPAHRLHIHQGLFADTFPKAAVPPIAVLRLDADWYDSTLLCLERFWDGLLGGALVVIDDYYSWEGCRKAVHEFLARRRAPEPIRQSRFGKIAYLIKS
jgi:O-methyltransferase